MTKYTSNGKKGVREGNAMIQPVNNRRHLEDDENEDEDEKEGGVKYKETRRNSST